MDGGLMLISIRIYKLCAVDEVNALMGLGGTARTVELKHKRTPIIILLTLPDLHFCSF